MKVRVPVTIRTCREEDLRPLEWFGVYRRHREIIQDAFQRQEAGENLMLIAEANGFPVGQVWIDLVRCRERRAGFFWAVRVFPAFQGVGLGARLITTAERRTAELGFEAVELGVRKENEGALRFYRRHGYRSAGELKESYRFTTPEGERVTVPLDEWVLRKDLAVSG